MKKLISTLFILLAIYFIWSSLGKNYDQPQSFKIDSFESFGDSVSQGNLVGLQTFMETGDYATEGRFYQKMQFYFEQAKQKNWLIPYRTVVVLPEYLGTWLVVANEKTGVYDAKQMQSGLTKMVASNIFSFAKSYFSAPAVDDKIKYAAFAMKAQLMAEIYQRVFSDLAKKYKVTVVAGSILLPNPYVEDHELKIRKGEMLYNTSAIFRPDGEIAPELVKKAFPTSDEQPFVCPVKSEEIPVFDTPLGKMGVLICADAWFANSYKNLKAKGATFIVVPSYSSGFGLWNKPWSGYSGAETPADSRADVGKITLGEAWQKHAMAMRANNEAGIKKGINVFLQGNLWDLGTDGTTVILNDSASTTKKFGGAAIVNLWL